MVADIRDSQAILGAICTEEVSNRLWAWEKYTLGTRIQASVGSWVKVKWPVLKTGPFQESILSLTVPSLNTRVTCPGKAITHLELLGEMSLSALELASGFLSNTESLPKNGTDAYEGKT